MGHEAYLSTKELLAHGWTKRLIGLFLVKPDKTVLNPYKHGSHAKALYLFRRVEELQQSGEFGNEKARSIGYSRRLAREAEIKVAQSTAIADGIALPELSQSIEDLLSEASSRRNANSASRISSETQVAVDILLDTMKSLEWHLDPLVWHPGIKHARKLRQSRMLANITDHYPILVPAALERSEQGKGDSREW